MTVQALAAAVGDVPKNANENVEKQTPDDPDLPLLKRAFETVSGVAMHINQSLRRQVDTLKLLELQNCFFPPVIFVAPGRRLIKKGELDKIAEKNNSKQKYVFFLFNDALAYGSKLFGGYYRFHRMLTVTGMDELTMTDHTVRFQEEGRSPPPLASNTAACLARGPSLS